MIQDPEHLVLDVMWADDCQDSATETSRPVLAVVQVLLEVGVAYELVKHVVERGELGADRAGVGAVLNTRQAVQLVVGAPLLGPVRCEQRTAQWSAAVTGGAAASGGIAHGPEGRGRWGRRSAHRRP